jgi:hypothetical protein
LTSAGNQRDLYSFDPAAMLWAPLSPAAGSAPSPSERYWYGFAAVGGKLYVHGGSSDTFGAARGLSHGGGGWVTQSL